MPRGVPLNGPERDQARTHAVSRYRGSLTTCREIATELGYSATLVRDLLIEAGVAMPTRGRRAGKRYGARRSDDVLPEAYGRPGNPTDDEIDDELRAHLGGDRGFDPTPGPDAG